MAEISLTGDQMLTVLEVVANNGPLSAADVSRTCAMNRTVAHRLLSTLAMRNYVRRIDKGYIVGPAALQLSRAADIDLRDAAKPVMMRLSAELGETVVLTAIDKLEAVVVDEVRGQRHALRVAHSPESRHPLDRGASGWALLAYQPASLIAKVIRKSADPDAVQPRIERIRRDGYAMSHDELQTGVHGVSVPVLEIDGRCNLSLGILVPENRAESLLRLIPALCEAAAEIVTAVQRE